MTDTNAPDPAARLEAALERISHLAARPPEPLAVPDPSPPDPAPPDPALLARMDDLIQQLRAALDEEDADGPDQP